MEHVNCWPYAYTRSSSPCIGNSSINRKAKTSPKKKMRFPVSDVSYIQNPDIYESPRFKYLYAELSERYGFEVGMDMLAEILGTSHAALCVRRARNTLPIPARTTGKTLRFLTIDVCAYLLHSANSPQAQPYANRRRTQVPESNSVSMGM